MGKLKKGIPKKGSNDLGGYKGQPLFGKLKKGF